METASKLVAEEMMGLTEVISPDVLNQRANASVEGEAPSGFARGGGDASPCKLKNRHRIEILGRAYALRGDTDEAYAKELATLVDQKMRKLAANAKGVELSKLAIFTAINIAHELCSLKKQQEAQDASLHKMIASLEEQLERLQ